MAIQFPVSNRAYYDNADWLDNCSAFSWAGWVRFDSIEAADYQFVWSHPGVTDRMEVYKKLSSPQYVRFQVLAGGVGVTVDDTTGAPSAGTKYHWAVTWQKNTSGGIKIYRNGSFVAQANTTSQTANYNSGGSVDLYLASKWATSYGRCTCEGWGFWAGTALSATQIAALYWAGWPHLATCPKPSAHWLFAPDLLTRIPDCSGNSRHITSSWISSGVSAVGTMGKWEDPGQEPGGYHRQVAAGPSPPDPWTLWSTVLHPTLTSLVTGLSNGTTYQFCASAVDTSSNESIKSDIVEATPQDVGVVHTPRRVFIGH